MKKRIWLLSLVLLALLVPPVPPVLVPSLAAEPEVKFVDKDTLKGMLVDPSLLIIDVRHQGEWEKSDRKIKGAIRFSPDRAASWGPLLPKDKKIVLY